MTFHEQHWIGYGFPSLLLATCASAGVLELVFKHEWLRHSCLKTFGVTDELGRQAPHRRDEVARRRRQIQTKLVQAVAELVSFADEIALSCDSCQANYEN